MGIHAVLRIQALEIHKLSLSCLLRISFNMFSWKGAHRTPITPKEGRRSPTISFVYSFNWVGYIRLPLRRIPWVYFCGAPAVGCVSRMVRMKILENQSWTTKSINNYGTNKFKEIYLYIYIYVYQLHKQINIHITANAWLTSHIFASSYWSHIFIDVFLYKTYFS